MTQDLFRHLRIHANSGEEEMDMKQLDARQQLLVIMMEECGELIQACSKALRRGELYQYSDSESQLKQEIADVYCMIELMQDWDVLSWEEIERGVERKREKLRVWSDLIEQNAAMRALEKGYAAGVSFTKEPEMESDVHDVYAEDIEDEVHAIEQPDPPKSNQMEMNFPSNSVTWRQALGDDPRPDYNVTSSVNEDGYATISYERTEPTQSMKDEAGK